LFALVSHLSGEVLGVGDYNQTDFDAIADELNGRPRQTLEFATPSEQLARMLR
jgi:IS30 family transposase